MEVPEEQSSSPMKLRQDCVISTVPVKGEVLKKGDTVTLILSKGPEVKPVTVPTFVGLNIDEILAQLEGYGWFAAPRTWKW